MDLDLERIVEAILFAAREPVSIEQLLSLFDVGQKPKKRELQQVLKTLQSYYDHRSVELKELASGFQFQVRAGLSEWVQRLYPKRSPKYSRALLEILSIIAYRQPITRGEIEDIRGVQVSSSLMATLGDHQWIQAVGHRDVPGKPVLYGTTKHFLDYFGLKSLTELPEIGAT
jgi:segregation and condensation protein B